MTSILEFFTFNKSFLSGAMDMIVIRHPDGSLKSSPLRVRFGQFKILKAKEKKVQIIVNDKTIELPMRLSEHGEVYVLHESRRRERIMSEDFMSSPSEGSSISSPRSTKDEKKSERIKFNLEDISNETISNSNTSTKDEKVTLSNVINFSIIAKKEGKENNVDKDCLNIDNLNNTNNSPVFSNYNVTSTSTKSNENSFIFDQPLPKMNLELSNCWDLISKNKKEKTFNFNETFNKNKISQEEFNKDPWKVINNSNLAIKYESHIYTWKVIAPLVLSQLAYNSELPEDVLHTLTQQQNGFLMWKTIQRDAFKIDIEKYDEKPTVIETPPLIKTKKYRKSYTFSSAQLESMNLKPGRNTITFIVTSSYQGKQELSSDIYLWEYTDKILVSDFDGTVTRSDVIGQFFALLGRDWSHKRIVKLYNDISDKGYKILYLTARTMCSHTQTKNYLYSITQDKLQMPNGPILMSPEGLVSSLKREVIDRSPENFKIECLTMVMNLFPCDVFPFYCGIGNKKTDALAYESVGISKYKIYIINERGEISTSNTSYKLTYEQMDDIVNELFPFVNDNGFNSLFFDNKTLRYFEPDSKKIINEDFEKELKLLLK